MMKVQSKTRYIVLVVGLLLLPQCLLAKDIESTAGLRALAKSYLQKQISLTPGETAQIEVDKLDKNLRLPKCTVVLQAFLPKSSQHNGINTVGVSCYGTQHWTIYIPVDVSIYSQVVVASKNLYRNQVIAENDLKLVKRNRNALRNGYYSNRQRLLGMVVQRHVNAGAVINHRIVKPQALVRRGEMVLIVARSGSVHVEMQGVARSDGALHKRIRVYNSSSRRMIEAIVIGRGKVEVPM